MGWEKSHPIFNIMTKQEIKKELLSIIELQKNPYK